LKKLWLAKNQDLILGVKSTRKWSILVKKSSDQKEHDPEILGRPG
jgi:hypothetical protein